MIEGQTPLRAAVIGCGGMGLAHARSLAALADFTVVAGCDLQEELAQRFAEQIAGARPYTDLDRMLAEQRPDVVVVATNNVTHAPLAIRAAEAGARGVICEKPMATCLADGRAMVEACRRANTALIVHHQRRMLPEFVTLRRLIAEGALGEVRLIRAGCAGDVLSDGTHLVDTLRHLAGDAEVRRVFGQIHRLPPDPAEEPGQGFPVSGGWRYGHPVESGAMAVVEFADGLRAELFTGTLQPRGRPYQDYEVIGSAGRVVRAGDRADPPLLLLRDDRAGAEAVPLDPPQANRYELFARMVREGAGHPLAGESALRDLEVVMAIYESARLRDWVELPLEQPRFPLEILIERGEL